MIGLPYLLVKHIDGIHLLIICYGIVELANQIVSLNENCDVF